MIKNFAEAELLPKMRTVSREYGRIVVEPVVELVPLSIAAEHPAVTFVKRLVGRNDHSKVAYGTEAGLFSERAGIASVVWLVRDQSNKRTSRTSIWPCPKLTVASG